MDFQSFKIHQFRNLLRRRDFIRLGETHLTQILEELENRLTTEDNYQFNEPKQTVIQGKTTYFLGCKTNSEICDDFVLRKIDHNLKRIYKVKQGNRDAIVKYVVNLLQEKTPYFIYKLDIKDFYESIDRNDLFRYIEDSIILSYQTKQLLKAFFEACPSLSGLPRGINISATLSELFMRRFDRCIKELDGVCYYTRFVDDILIFSLYPLEIKNLADILSRTAKGVAFNMSKFSEINAYQCDKSQFDYLGYSFVICPSNISKPVSICISNKKLRKIKSRIVYALLDYNKSTKPADFKLLKKRLVFLSCIYPIRSAREKISKYVNLGALKAGLRYSYSEINNYEEDC